MCPFDEARIALLSVHTITALARLINGYDACAPTASLKWLAQTPKSKLRIDMSVFSSCKCEVETGLRLREYWIVHECESGEGRLEIYRQIGKDLHLESVNVKRGDEIGRVEVKVPNEQPLRMLMTESRLLMLIAEANDKEIRNPLPNESIRDSFVAFLKEDGIELDEHRMFSLYAL